jgi:hypothetical protein
MADQDRSFTQTEVNDIVEKRLARERRSTEVVSEPRTYGPDSPHSFIMDQVAIVTSAASNRKGAALTRMQRYAQELVYEMDNGTLEGRAAERIIRAQNRAPEPHVHRENTDRALTELRAFGTAGGISVSGSTQAASFVPPYVFTELWAPYRGKARSFADQCHKVAMPEYGLNIYVPYFSTAESVASQTEGSAASQTSPVAALESATVKTIAGRVALSQQVQDRAHRGGGTIDEIVFHQMLQQLNEQVDIYALTTAIGSGNKPTGSSTFKLETLYEDIASARHEVAVGAAGVYLRPTHFFSTTDFYSYVTRQFDSSKRPIVVPRYAPGFPLSSGADDWDSEQLPQWSRFTGTVLPGGVLWFTDDNIPASGSNTQLIVSAPDDALILFEDAPQMTVFAETLANELKVVLRISQYTSLVTRHAGGTATITSNAYTTSLS